MWWSCNKCRQSLPFEKWTHEKNILWLKLKIRENYYYCVYCKLFVKIFIEGHHKILNSQKIIENKNDLKKSITHFKADIKCDFHCGISEEDSIETEYNVHNSSMQHLFNDDNPILSNDEDEFFMNKF